MDKASRTMTRPKASPGAPPLASWGPFALTVLLFLPFFPPFFETNDDALKDLLIRGQAITPGPCEYLLVSNILLGKALKTLVVLGPGVPGWGLLLVSAFFLALATFHFALVQDRPGMFRPLLFTVVLAGAGLPFFFLLQFTCVAILAGGAGLFLLWTLWKLGRPSPLGLTLAGLSLLISFLLRPEAFGLCLAFGLPLAWLDRRGGASPPHRQKGPFLTFTAVLSLLVLCAGAFDHWAYARDPAWGPFLSFNNVRTRFLDHGRLAPEEGSRALLEKVGWDPIDLELFQSWYFFDPVKYSRENLEELERGSRSLHPFHFSPEEVLGNLPPKALAVLAALFLLLLALVPAPRKRGPLLALAWALALVLGMASTVKVANWVVFPLLFLCLLRAVGEVEPPARRPAWKAWPAALLAGFSLTLAFLYHSSYSHLRDQRASLKQDLGRLSPKPDQLYLAWGSAFPFEKLGALDDLRSLKDLHLFPMAVFQRSPAAAALLDRFSVKDPFGELPTRKDLLLICTQRQGALYGAHMKGSRGVDIRARKDFSGETFQVYRIGTLARTDRR